MAMAFLVIGERQPRVTLLAAVVGVGRRRHAGLAERPRGHGGCRGRRRRRGGRGVVGRSGFTLVKRWSPPDDVLVTTSWQLVAGGLLLLPVAAVVEGAPPALDGTAVAALVYLGLVGSALGYVLWFRGLTRMDAGAVAVVGLVNPVVGTALGVLLLAEPFGPVHLAAVVVTLGSVLVAQAPVAPRRLGRPVLHGSPGGHAPRPTAYRGLMPHVTTTDLTTPTGPVPIPTIGFGVWQVPDDQVDAAVSAALEAGYRHVDTARLYGNEAGVGRALAASDVAARRRLRHDQGLERRPRARRHARGVRRLDGAARARRARPVPHPLARARPDRYVETWQALRELRDDGRVRAIGVCNFHAPHLQRLFDETGEWPSINQVELHPYLQQAPLREFHARARHRHRVVEPARVGQAGARRPGHRARSRSQHGATPAQVVIAWHLALGLVVLPKSVTPSRIVENLAAADLTLTADDLAALAGLDRGFRTGPNPDEFDKA